MKANLVQRRRAKGTFHIFPIIPVRSGAIQFGAADGVLMTMLLLGVGTLVRLYLAG